MSVEENTNFVDYYSLLRVMPSAELIDIRKAYLHMAKMHHPDAGGTTAMMQQLNTAYRTLTGATSRAAYDMLHSFHTGGTPSQYREVGGPAAGSAKDMSDEYVDFFIDSVFAEYHQTTKPKPNLRTKLKTIFKAR